MFREFLRISEADKAAVVDIICELEDYCIEVFMHDPLADAKKTKRFYGLELQKMNRLAGVGAVIVAVTHESYKK